MEPLAQGVGADVVDTGIETWHQFPTDAGPSELLQHTPGFPETVDQHRFTVSHEGQMSMVQETIVQSVADKFDSLQLDLQDSCFSPVLTLIPQARAFITSESTLLHQTDSEFAPLRGSPDLSAVLDGYPQMSHLDVDIESNLQDRSLEQASLSQHPLGATTAISENVSSCCSLSQHSLSPHIDQQASWFQENKFDDGLGKNNEKLLDGEEKEINVNGAGIDNVTVGDSISKQFSLSMVREQPQGGCTSSVSHKKTTESVETSLSSRMSAISNITVRCTRMQPDETTDLCHRQLKLQSDATISTPESTNQIENKIPLSAQYVSSASVMGLPRAPKDLFSHLAAHDSFLTSRPVSQSTPAVIFGKAAPVPTELTPIYSQQNTGVTSITNTKHHQIPVLDLSTTNPLPKVLHATSLNPDEAQTEPHINYEKHLNQAESSLKVNVLALASEDLSFDPHTRSSRSTPQSPSDQALPIQELMLSSGRVHSLPSLSYLEKVDAWKASQSSSRLFHDLAVNRCDGVSSEKKAQDSASEALNLLLSQQSLDYQSREVNISGLRHGDLAEAVNAVQPTPASPLAHSHSHSSLGTVIVPVQQDGTQNDLQILPVHSVAITLGNDLTATESLPLSGHASDERLADQSRTDPIRSHPLFALGQFGDLPAKPSVGSTFSSFKGSCYGEQSFHESLGAASSVVSLEVDNYAPYWTSRPSSPPHSFELNIEDRIPLYLRNLGIDQSPSKILNPFTRRGPIREPEFSPTEFCTIKDSVGTPSKSTLPSEGDSPRKETFSSSTMHSSDSSSSLTQQEVQKPGRPASPGSVRMIQTSTPPKSVPTGSDTSQREGSYGLPAQFSVDPVPPPGTRMGVTDPDSSLVGSATLQEIRHLLGRAESLMSAQSSLTSSLGSRLYSESDTSMLSLRQNTQMCHDDSSLSLGGRISSTLARSSSDSALKPCSSLSSSFEAPRLSTPSYPMTSAPSAVSQSMEENLKSRDVCVAQRRAEPEGCSAADPDRVGPVSLMVKKMNAAVTSYGQQQSHDSADDVGVSASIGSPSHSSAEGGLSTPLGSDSGSEYSLAARVAKLLQSESSVSVIPSRPSTTDTDKSRAGEVMVKVSGGESKAIGLNTEDRKRIEEIKRELLLHTKLSSDSESSEQSGTMSRPTIGFAVVRSAEDRLSEQLQRANELSLDFPVPSHISPPPSLEDRVRQIAVREGISLTPPFPSVSTATTQQTPSPHPTRHHPHVHIDHVTHKDAPPDEESKLQTQEPDKETEKEGIGIVRKDKNEHQVNKRADSIAVQVNALEDLEVEREISPGLESASLVDHKGHVSDIQLTFSPKPKQKTKQTLQPPTSDASSYFHLQNGLPAHQSDKMSRQKALKKISYPVLNTSKEHNPGVSGETISTKHKEVDQNTAMIGGYSQRSSRHQQTRPGSSRDVSVQAAAIPTLLPYKPHGSAELFYMPKTDQELSPNSSETSMESSHTGSDDAVPPPFSTEVLGSREFLDRNIKPKHKEGIYSKRAKMNRESIVSGIGFCDSKVPAFTQTDCTGAGYQLNPSSFSRESGNNQGAVHSTEQNESEEDGFVQLNIEADYCTEDHHHHHHHHHHSNTVRMQNLPEPETLSLPTKASRNVEKSMKARDISVEIGNSLDQLWHRFNRSYSLQESRPIDKGEVSLLERLERLSRLLNSPSLSHTPTKQADSQLEKGKNIRRDPKLRRVQNEDATTKEKKERSRRVKSLHEVKKPPKTAWEDTSLKNTQTFLEEVQQENEHRCPAERDESTSVSVETTSSSRSTIDTQRLLRAFGPQKVSNGEHACTSEKKTSGSLLKVYNSIHNQKTEHGKSHSKHHFISVATETSSADESRASFDTLSSSSSYSVSFQRDTRGGSKRRKKLVSRGIQAGDLEIVVNGTRRHTRDVGTTFPSPGGAKDIRAPAAHSVSWFVSADLKTDARKENEPQSESLPFKKQAWFEPVSRVQPWREPLKERHIQGVRETPSEPTSSSENGTSSKPSALVYLSLQEALEFHRPKFVSRSRQRMKKLCLLAEERKMQAVFNKEREELFNQPLLIQPPTAASARAAPPAPPKRVIPVGEMVQRSKRIYSQLPEVQKRKEEERRKTEYRTNRLNAQLFNKKITNRVLGRRAPWQ